MSHVADARCSPPLEAPGVMRTPADPAGRARTTWPNELVVGEQCTVCAASGLVVRGSLPSRSLMCDHLLGRHGWPEQLRITALGRGMSGLSPAGPPREWNKLTSVPKFGLSTALEFDSSTVHTDNREQNECKERKEYAGMEWMEWWNVPTNSYILLERTLRHRDRRSS